MAMRSFLALLVFTALVQAENPTGAPGDELRTALADIDLKGDWKYHDLAAGIAEAKATGKPLMVVYRCVPCVMCRSLDGVVRRREDPKMAELMDQFVCVRMVQAWDMDLSLFQTDSNLSWVVYFMNPDKTLYGRYGHGRNSDTDISVEGFRAACEEALQLHAQFPQVKASLAGKIGPAPQWAVPQQIPDIAKQQTADPAKGPRFKKVTTDPKGCIHCHHVEMGIVRDAYQKQGRWTDANLWRFPMPDAVGLTMDPKQAATVAAAAPGGAGAKAGFKAGDKITHFAGQPVISIADLQWVLEHTGETGSIAAKIDRGGKSSTLTLKLQPGWRRNGDFAWRTICWHLRQQLIGFNCETLSEEQRRELKLPSSAFGFKVRKLPPNWVKGLNKTPQAAGLKEGDIVLGVDRIAERWSESRWIAYFAQEKRPGDPVRIQVLRGDQMMEIAYKVGKLVEP